MGAAASASHPIQSLGRKHPSTKMSCFMLSLILLLIPLLGYSEAEASGLVMYNQCGDSLMELMSKVCNNQFNEHFNPKRCVLNLFDYVDSLADTDDAAGAVIRPHHPRMNSLMATRRIARYVAKECCLKPCSRAEIDAHCKPTGRESY